MKKLFLPIDNSPLIIFRIFFGFLLAAETFGAIFDWLGQRKFHKATIYVQPYWNGMAATASWLRNVFLFCHDGSPWHFGNAWLEIQMESFCFYCFMDPNLLDAENIL